MAGITDINNPGSLGGQGRQGLKRPNSFSDIMSTASDIMNVSRESKALAKNLYRMADISDTSVSLNQQKGWHPDGLSEAVVKENNSLLFGGDNSSFKAGADWLPDKPGDPSALSMTQFSNKRSAQIDRLKDYIQKSKVEMEGATDGKTRMYWSAQIATAEKELQSQQRTRENEILGISGSASQPKNRTALVEQGKILAKRLSTARASYGKKQSARATEHASIAKRIKKTALIVVIFALGIATACELLSLVDLGWILSWLIPIFTWFMARRITGMKKAAQSITEATSRLHREEKLARQRLVAILPAPERAALGVQSKLDTAAAEAQSYVTMWIRDSILTQLVELIPVVDWLPFYLGQVIKMVIDQNIEYQKTKKLMPSYERTLASTDKFERMEVEYLQKRLTLLLGQLNASPEQQPRTTPKAARSAPAKQPEPVQPRPAPVRDIAPSLSPAAA